MSKAVLVVGAGLNVSQRIQRFTGMLLLLFAAAVFCAAAFLPKARAQASVETSADANQAISQAMPTSTELSVATDDSGPGTHAKFTVRVNGSHGSPAGVVTLADARGPIGSAALDADGVATFAIDGMRPGANRIIATYSGTRGDSASTSPAVVVDALATGIADYSLALNPTALTLKAGTDGTMIATITPTSGFSQLVSLSCSGNGIPLPVGVSCLFTPVNLVPAASGAILTSSLSIQTTGVAGKTALEPLSLPERHPFYAILVPGILALAGLSAARKQAYNRAFAAVRFLSLAVLLLLSGLGLGSCAARYHYLHNPPAPNFGTPLGTYTLIITASSNSNSSITIHSQTIALTVN